MGRIDEYDEVINAVYEALLAPERLVVALDAMTRFLDGDTCHLVGWDRSTFEPVLSVSCGLPEEIGPEYAAHYTRIDPRHQLSLRMAPGSTLACHKYFDRYFVDRSEFFQDYLIRHAGVHYLLGAGDLVPNSQDLLVLGFHRRVGHTHFSDEEIGWFERLMPHFVRVLDVLNAQLKNSWSTTVKGVTDQLSHLAVFALDETGRLLEANECAVAILRTNDPFVLRYGRIKALANDLDATFEQKFFQALNGAASHLTITVAGGERSLCVTFIPAPEDPLQILTSRRLAVVMIASGTTPRRVATAAQLMEFFRLTAAEARLVRALCRDEDVQSYADDEGLKVTTVRSHLKAAMEKTGARTQRDLVRMVTSIPAVRD